MWKYSWYWNMPGLAWRALRGFTVGCGGLYGVMLATALQISNTKLNYLRNVQLSSTGRDVKGRWDIFVICTNTWQYVTLIINLCITWINIYILHIGGLPVFGQEECYWDWTSKLKLGCWHRKPTGREIVKRYLCSLRELEQILMECENSLA